jgi:hypothetical protein
VLLAWDWSRVSRTGLRGVGRVLETLEQSGARLVTLRDNLDSSSPTFGIITAVVAETSRAEREAISARVKSRQSHDRDAGLWTKPAPYGYAKANGGKLKPDPKTAKHLRSMFKDFLNGDSLRSIATRLNQAEVPAPRGGLWGVSSVRHILASPSSAALLHHNGQLVRNQTGEVVHVATKPVISFADHRKAVEMLAAKHQPRGRKPSGPRYPLSGLMRCSVCGAAFVFQSRGGNRRAYLRCSGRMDGGCSGSRYVIADDLLHNIQRRVLARLSAEEPDSEWLGLVAQRLGLIEIPPAASEVAEAREAKAEVEARLAEMEDAYYTGRAFKGTPGKKRYQSTHAALTAELEQLDTVIGKAVPVLDVSALMDPSEYEDADWPALRHLFQATIERVMINADKTSNIEWLE